MTDRFKPKIECAEFELRLSDVLDGAMTTMTGTELEEFRAHAATCGDCGSSFELAQTGMQWLRALPPVEPPAKLVHNILAATSLAETSAMPMMAGNAARNTETSWLRRLSPVFAAMRQPRFAMTAAMAFFSISMLMSLTGVRVSDLKNLDLRPSAITTSASVQYHQTTARVVRYYENIRFIYEMESRMRALKKASGAGPDSGRENPKPDGNQPNNREDNTSGNPEQNQNQNYGVDENNMILVEQKQMTSPDFGSASPEKIESNRRNS